METVTLLFLAAGAIIILGQGPVEGGVGFYIGI
jgi:hypothetical protein